MTRGKLIVLEGIDGSGKTTVARLVQDKLRLNGIGVLLEAEPSKGQVGRMLRDVLRNTSKERLKDVRFGVQLALLMAADRVDHYWNVMHPVLANGTSILCDRYVWSSYAYQGALGVDLKFIENVNATVLDPDHVIFIEVDPEVACQRIQAARVDPDLFDSAAQLKKLADSYYDLLWKHRLSGVNIGTYTLIEGNAALDTVVERVYETVLKVIQATPL